MKKKIPIPNEWSMKDVQHTDRCWWWLASLFMAVMLVVIVVTVVSCTDDPVVQEVPQEQEKDLPATIRLEILPDRAEQVQTRVAEKDESAIKDLHILVYNSRGELIGKSYNTKTPFKVSTRSGSNNTIYAIANTDNSKLFDGTIADTETKLKAMKTLALKKWDELTTASHLVMVGKKTNVTIKAGSDTLQGGITVERITGKVKLSLTTDGTDIKITSFKICNLPALSYYVPNPTKTESSKEDKDDKDIVNTDTGKDAAAELPAWIQGLEIKVDYKSGIDTTFYMYENRRGVISSITNQQNKSRAYAPANATYVVIEGEASGYSAIWTVYLGANNTSNFNIKRNCNYTYNIKLKEGNRTDTRVVVEEKDFTTIDGASSNCYMLSPGAAVTIPVSRANESTIEGGTKTQILDATEWEAEIIWQSSAFLLYLKRSTRSGKGASGRFTVAATDAQKEGNGLVAIRNKKTKEILWSWHIWVTTYDGGTIFSTINSQGTFILMDRALGADSPTSRGLFYQWGRKDPFPSLSLKDGLGNDYSIKNSSVPSNAVPNNLINATRYPGTFYYNENEPNDWFIYNNSFVHNSALWSSGAKSVFDPCPEGWRIPSLVNGISAFAYFTATNGPWGNNGRNWGVNGFFPAAGVLGSSSGIHYSEFELGYYWIAGIDDKAHGANLKFTNDMVAPRNNTPRGTGMLIRCCKL